MEKKEMKEGSKKRKKRFLGGVTKEE